MANDQLADRRGIRCRKCRIREREAFSRWCTVCTVAEAASEDRISSTLAPVTPIQCPHCERLIEPKYFRCLRCRYRFQAIEAPARCPRCDSRYWDVKRGTLKRGRPPKQTP